MDQKDLPEKKKTATKDQLEAGKTPGNKKNKKVTNSPANKRGNIKKKPARKLTRKKGETRGRKPKPIERDYSNVGRKPEYDPAYHIPLAVGLARAGFSMDKIAELMKKSRNTVYRWKVDHPEFAQALEGGKTGYIQGIVNKLTQRAEGYEAIEEQTEFETVDIEIDDPDSPGEKKTVKQEIPVKRKVTKKQIAPDVAAIMQILTNKDPENWKNKQSIDMDGKLGVTDENQRDLAKELVNIPGVREAIIQRFRERALSPDSKG
jgi:hypothetical protein